MEEKELLETAINPFALAEIISDKKITWSDDLEQQKKKLSSVLGMPIEDIMSDSSPVLHPYIDAKSKKILSKDLAKSQLDSYLDSRMTVLKPVKKITTTLEKKRTAALVNKKRIIDVLFKGEETPDLKADHTPDNCTWKDNGVIFQCAPEGDDPMQGGLGDCYFIASIAATAWAKPYSIINRASLSYCDSTGDAESNITHQIDFYKESSSGNYSTKVSVEVTDSIPLNSNSPIYAKSFDAKETWPSVYEKAYAKYRNAYSGDKPNYWLIGQGGASRHTIGEVTGGKVTVKWHNSTSASALLKFIQGNCNAWTLNNYWGKDGYSHRLKNPMVAGCLTRNDCGVVSGHAYSVLGFDHDDQGQYYVVLRNPWGRYPAVKDVKIGNWNVISYRKGYGSSIPLNVSSSTSRWGGIFALKLESYLKIFAYTAVSVY